MLLSGYFSMLYSSVGMSYPLDSSSLNLAHKKLAHWAKLNVYAIRAELSMVLEATCTKYVYILTAQLYKITSNQPIMLP